MKYQSLGWMRPPWARNPIAINLGTREGFAIASAIRGPDHNHAPRLKQALTARFRHLATGATGCMQLGGFSVNPDPIVEEDTKALIAETITASDKGMNVIHYLAHIADGADALAKLFRKDDPDRAEQARRLSELAHLLKRSVNTDRG